MKGHTTIEKCHRSPCRATKKILEIDLNLNYHVSVLQLTCLKRGGVELDKMSSASNIENASSTSHIFLGNRHDIFFLMESTYY